MKKRREGKWRKKRRRKLAKSGPEPETQTDDEMEDIEAGGYEEAEEVERGGEDGVGGVLEGSDEAGGDVVAGVSEVADDAY